MNYLDLAFKEADNMIGHKLTVGAGIAVTGAMVGGPAAVGLLKAGNKHKLGYTHYGDGPARMTSSFTTGTPQALQRASGGNYELYSEMAKPVVRRGLPVDDLGADEKFISALYNMNS